MLCRHPLAAMGIGRLAPHADHVARAGPAQRDPVAGEREDAAQPGLAQKTGIVDIKTPGICIPGALLTIVGLVQDQPPDPCTSVAVVASVLTAPKEPSSDEIVLLHWAKGASVT